MLHAPAGWLPLLSLGWLAAEQHVSWGKRAASSACALSGPDALATSQRWPGIPPLPRPRLGPQAAPLFPQLLRRALRLVRECGCAGRAGCPACVQHADCSEYNAVLHKPAAAALLEALLGEQGEGVGGRGSGQDGESGGSEAEAGGAGAACAGCCG